MSARPEIHEAAPETLVAVYWHEGPHRQPVHVLWSGPYRWDGAVERKAHGACRIYGEGLMYGRDNMGIGLR